MFKRLALLLCGALVLGASPALAEENGLKVGDGRLHPYFDLEGDYDTAAQLVVNSDGTASGLVFAPRTISRRDTGVSARRRAQVEAKWQQMRQAAAPVPAATGSGNFVPPPDPSRPPPPAAVAPPDPAAAALRKEELRTLPYVP